MRLESYDFVSGNALGKVQSLDFGDVRQKGHCQRTMVLRAFADVEPSISNLTLYLESKGNWPAAEFGYYIHPSFQPKISPGSSQLSSHFTEMRDASSGSPYGIPVGMTGNSSDFIWLDVDLPSAQLGATSANFRFVF